MDQVFYGGRANPSNPEIISGHTLNYDDHLVVGHPQYPVELLKELIHHPVIVVEKYINKMFVGYIYPA